MTRKQAFAIAATGLILAAVFVVWFLRAPHTTLMLIKEAATHGDTATLNRLIDFPSFRSSIKLLITDAVDADPQESKPGRVLGRMIAGALAGPIVDAAVTPESIALMFSGKGPLGTKAAGKQGETQTAEGSGPKAEMVQSWDSTSTVRIRVQRPDDTAPGITFVMLRNGLSWRLSGVEK